VRRLERAGDEAGRVTPATSKMEVSASGVLGADQVLAVAEADVGKLRERGRRRRLARLGVLAGMLAMWALYRVASGQPVNPLAGMDLWFLVLFLPALLLTGVMIFAVLGPQLTQGRSPHLLYRPEQIDVTLDDVKGLGPVRDEVIRSLNLFLAHATFTDQLGGTPRRGLLFEGPPGTGKTHMAKAMARAAGVPFLYVSATSFQSMWYGMTGRKIRSYFKRLRKVARAEGGAIGFIEEIDAIGAARGGMESFTAHAQKSGFTVNKMMSQGTGAVVNELLVQMQSFDEPPFGQRVLGKLTDWINGYLPAGGQIKRRKTPYTNILLIAATNRAETLDAALLRPGRFDRTLTFDLPGRAGRRDLIDHFLSRKAHVADLDDPARRDELARITFGYSPVMIEHLLDESLIVAMRSGREALNWSDLLEAKLAEEIGLAQPVAYTSLEREMVATHEAGHAVVAFLSGVGRKLEVLSIVKRKDALGLLAHNDSEERWTRTRTELEAFLRISAGGMAAEEIFFGEPTTGPGGDLAAATGMAAEMVGTLGMAGSLTSYMAMQEGLADRNVVARVLANPEGRERVEQLLQAAKAEARATLEANRHLVEALRDALLARDELVGDEIVEVLTRAGSAPESAGELLPHRPVLRIAHATEGSAAL
jgi:cell division protease FtsH